MFPHNPLCQVVDAAWRRRCESVPTSRRANPVIDEGPLANDLRLQLALQENRRLVLALQSARHSAGNQLALLAALLARQSRTSRESEVRRALQTAQLRIHAVANAMRPDALGDTSEFVCSKSLVERAVEGLLELASDAGVEIEVDVQEFRLQRDDAFSYMLIINELTVNSLKHAFPNSMGGVIRLRFAHEPGERRGSRSLSRTTASAEVGGRRSRRTRRDGDRFGDAEPRREAVRGILLGGRRAPRAADDHSKAASASRLAR